MLQWKVYKTQMLCPQLFDYTHILIISSKNIWRLILWTGLNTCLLSSSFYRCHFFLQFVFYCILLDFTFIHCCLVFVELFVVAMCQLTPSVFKYHVFCCAFDCATYNTNTLVRTDLYIYNVCNINKVSANNFRRNTITQQFNNLDFI